MSIKGWLRQKIRNAAGVEYLEYIQSAQQLELEKLSGMQAERATRGEDRLTALEQAQLAQIQTQNALRQEQAQADESLINIKDAQASQSERVAQTELHLTALEESQTVLRKSLETWLSEQCARTEHLTQQLIVQGQELQQIKAISTSGRRVKLVEYRSMKLFMYDNDLIPDKTTEDYRRTAGLIDAYDGILNGCNAMPLLFEHYWKHGLDFTLLDVGCQYGHESILAGKYMQAHGQANRIHCFDAGQTCSLMPFNLAVNELAGQVEFHQLAIGNSSEPMLMYYEPGYSEHNRSLNPEQSAENSVTFSYPVDCTTLDDFCSKQGINNYIIAKLDTEGSEPQIVEGMQSLMAHHPLAFFTEYSPYNFTFEHEQDYLKLLLQTHDLIDIGALQGAESGCERQAFLIPAERLGAYTQYLKQQATGWADVLALPRTLPHAEELLEKVSSQTPF